MTGRHIDLRAAARHQGLKTIGGGFAGVVVGVLFTIFLGGLIIGLIVGPFLMIAGIVAIVLGALQWIDPLRDASLRGLGRNDEERRHAVAWLEQELARTTQHFGMGAHNELSLLQGWIVVHGADFLVVRTSDLLWVHHAVTDHKRFGITIGKTHALVVRARGRGKQELRMAERWGSALLDVFANVAPQAFYGYVDRLDKLSDRELEQLVADRSAALGIAAPAPIPVPIRLEAAPPLSRGPANRTWLWVGGGALGLLVGGSALSCAGIVGFGVFLQQRTAALATACDGSPVSSAAAYVPGAPAPIVVMDHTDGGWTANYGLLPDGFVSGDTTAETPLVLCVEPAERAVLESCVREGAADGQRTRWERRARLVVARTGEVLADQVVTGPEPADCSVRAQRERSGAWPAANEWSAFLHGALE